MDIAALTWVSARGAGLFYLLPNLLSLYSLLLFYKRCWLPFDSAAYHSAFLHPFERFLARSIAIIRVHCSTEFSLALLTRAVPILNNGWFSPFFHFLLQHLPGSPSWIFKFSGACCKKSILLSPSSFFVNNGKEIPIDNADILLELSDLSPSGQQVDLIQSEFP